MLCSTSSNPPCLSSCTAQELIQYLLHNRFKDDSTEAATFLLEALDKIPNIEEINEHLNQQQEQQQQEKKSPSEKKNNGVNNSNTELLGDQILVVPQSQNNNNTAAAAADDDDDADKSFITVSSISPRSKFNLTMFENGCIMTNNNKNERIIIHYHDVKHVVMFPKREDCVKTPKWNKHQKQKIEVPGSIVLIIFKEEGKVDFRNKFLSQVCFQLPLHLSETLSKDHEQQPHHNNDEYDSVQRVRAGNIIDDFELKWEQLFHSSFQNDIVRIYNPRFNQLAKTMNNFQSDERNPDSSMIQGGMPYVKCYKGVNDGVLYPIDAGLLFFKPPLFIHRSELHSIACGRGHEGSSRFAELVVTLDDEKNKPLEFTNIDKEEVEGLNDYINNILIKAMMRDMNEEEKVGDESDFDGTDAEHDEDGDEKMIDESNDRKRKSQRSASVHARKATKVQFQSLATSADNIEEDDDDYFSESPSASDAVSEEDDTEKQEDYEEDSDTESEIE